jgi:hypothetical protein
MGFFLRIFVLVPAILSCEASRFYYLARNAEQPSGSAESRYVTSYTQADTQAVLSPRTDLNKHLGLHPKKAPLINARCPMLHAQYSAGIENPTGRMDRSSHSYGLHCDTLYNSLLCLHCLLTV